MFKFDAMRFILILLLIFADFGHQKTVDSKDTLLLNKDIRKATVLARDQFLDVKIEQRNDSSSYNKSFNFKLIVNTCDLDITAVRLSSNLTFTIDRDNNYLVVNPVAFTITKNGLAFKSNPTPSRTFCHGHTSFKDEVEGKFAIDIKLEDDVPPYLSFISGAKVYKEAKKDEAKEESTLLETTHWIMIGVAIGLILLVIASGLGGYCFYRFKIRKEFEKQEKALNAAASMPKENDKEKHFEVKNNHPLENKVSAEVISETKKQKDTIDVSMKHIVVGSNEPTKKKPMAVISSKVKKLPGNRVGNKKLSVNESSMNLDSD